MKDLETIIRELVDLKAEQNNQIDLIAYENGMRAFAKAINYTLCCTELKCSGCKKPLDDGLCGSCCSNLASGMY